MKFTCLHENLLKALNKVYRAVPARGELPILTNILISAQDGSVKLAATSLATTIVTNIPASVEQEGAITVPAKLLKEFISNLSSTTVEVDLQHDILHLNSETTQSRFNGITAEDFPDLPELSAKLDFAKIDAREFADAIGHVGFTASNDDSRPIFTGIFLDFKNDTLTVAASDGYRLSEVSVPLLDCPINYSVVIPAKILVDVSKIFSELEQNIEMSLDDKENVALFKQGDTVVATRILSGEYPDYRRIIPQNGTTKVAFDVATLLEAVKLTNIFAKEASSTIILNLDPEGNNIHLHAAAEEKGEHKGHINAEVESDKTLNIGFNSKFLLDFLTNIKSERVQMLTSGETTHCLFRPTDNDNFLHIIMPLGIASQR